MVIWADQTQQADDIPDDGEWHHYCFTHDWAIDTAALKYYLDGVLTKSTNRAPTTYGANTSSNESQEHVLKIAKS